jgi:hypothetical protein
LMHRQIEFEEQREVKSLKEVFRLYRHRAFTYVLTPCPPSFWVLSDTT